MSGTLLLEIDGQRQEINLSGCMTAEEVNARLRAAGAPERLRVLTVEDQERMQREREAWEAAEHPRLVDWAKNELTSETRAGLLEWQGLAPDIDVETLSLGQLLRMQMDNAPDSY